MAHGYHTSGRYLVPGRQHVSVGTQESGPRAGAAENLVRLNGELTRVLGTVEGADMDPTTQVVAAAADLERSLASVLAKWSEIQRTRLRPNSR